LEDGALLARLPGADVKDQFFPTVRDEWLLLRHVDRAGLWVLKR